MNIFLLDLNPVKAASYYPDILCRKIALEICQMLAMNYSQKYFNWGTLPKKDGTPYKTEKGAHKNHPCTIFIRQNYSNMAWSIVHGMALALEHKKRYGTTPATLKTLLVAKDIFHKQTGKSLVIGKSVEITDFPRAMPDKLKNDSTINTVEAYRQYLLTKNYLSWEKLGNVPDWLHTYYAYP